MRRLLALAMLWLPLAAAAQQLAPLLRQEMDATATVPGQAVQMRITLLVPTWMPEAPVFPGFEAPNVMTRLPEGAAGPTSETTSAVPVAPIDAMSARVAAAQRRPMSSAAAHSPLKWTPSTRTSVLITTRPSGAATTAASSPAPSRIPGPDGCWVRICSIRPNSPSSATVRGPPPGDVLPGVVAMEPLSFAPTRYGTGPGSTMPGSAARAAAARSPAAPTRSAPATGDHPDLQARHSLGACNRTITAPPRGRLRRCWRCCCPHCCPGVAAP